MIVNTHVKSLSTTARVNTCKYIVKITGAKINTTIALSATLLPIHLTVCIIFLFSSLAHNLFTLSLSRRQQTDSCHSYNISYECPHCSKQSIVEQYQVLAPCVPSVHPLRRSPSVHAG